MKTKKIILLSFLISFSGILLSQEQGTTETDPVNITAMAVINKYIYAIGGIDKFKSVIDRTTVMTGTAMGQPIDIVVLQKYPDKLFQELRAGEVKQLLYYSDGKGMLKIGNEKTEIEKKELERLMMDATMQLLLSPDSFGVKAEYVGVECIDSTDCYTLKLTLPSGIRWFQYYSTETDLKFKETKEIQTKQGLFEQETYFSDYKEVKGLKFPFTIKQYLGLQELDLNVTSIEINTGLDDSVFEIQ
jgi:outer membrane lipoprotein-sorting protein